MTADGDGCSDVGLKRCQVTVVDPMRRAPALVAFFQLSLEWNLHRCVGAPARGSADRAAVRRKGHHDGERIRAHGAVFVDREMTKSLVRATKRIGSGRSWFGLEEGSCRLVEAAAPAFVDPAYRAASSLPVGPLEGDASLLQMMLARIPPGLRRAPMEGSDRSNPGRPFPEVPFRVLPLAARLQPLVPRIRFQGNPSSFAYLDGRPSSFSLVNGPGLPIWPQPGPVNDASALWIPSLVVLCNPRCQGLLGIDQDHVRLAPSLLP